MDILNLITTKEGELELQKSIRAVSEKAGYMEVVEWINKNAPSDGYVEP